MQPLGKVEFTTPWPGATEGPGPAGPSLDRPGAPDGDPRPSRPPPMLAVLMVMMVLMQLLDALAKGADPAPAGRPGAPGGQGALPDPDQRLFDRLGGGPSDAAPTDAGPSDEPRRGPPGPGSTSHSDRHKARDGQHSGQASGHPSGHHSDKHSEKHSEKHNDKHSGTRHGAHDGAQHSAPRGGHGGDRRGDHQVDHQVDHRRASDHAPRSAADERALSKAPPSDRIPAPTRTVVVNEPIVVKAGQTFDGGGSLYKAGRALGDGGQSEDQQPVFILEQGATLKNVQVEGADGVHAHGDAHLKDVWWRDVGEDAFTLKSPGHVTVEGGGAFNATDKVFQINAAGSLSIDGFYAENFGKLVRQNGGTHFALDVSLHNVVTRGGHESLVRTDSERSTVSLNQVDPGSVKHVVIAPGQGD